MGTISSAVPLTKRYPQRIGTRLEWEGTLTMTSSYATGGDTLSPKLLGMSTIDGAVAAFSTTGAAALFEVLPQADGSAKIKATLLATDAEPANASDQSAKKPVVRIVGH